MASSHESGHLGSRPLAGSICSRRHDPATFGAVESSGGPPMRLLCVFLGISIAAAFSAQSSSYHVTQTFLLGGDGSWDYVVPDAPTHRLFIGRQTRVMVVDENTGKLIGEVMGIDGAHGTAIAAASGHGFATSG